jgi:hypothetical protein
MLTEADARYVWLREYMPHTWTDYGKVKIRGVEYGWWADAANVWFYDDPEKSGGDTCARFAVDHAFASI